MSTTTVGQPPSRGLHRVASLLSLVGKPAKTVLVMATSWAMSGTTWADEWISQSFEFSAPIGIEIDSEYRGPSSSRSYRLEGAKYLPGAELDLFDPSLGTLHTVFINLQLDSGLTTEAGGSMVTSPQFDCRAGIIPVRCTLGSDPPLEMWTELYFRDHVVGHVDALLWSPTAVNSSAPCIRLSPYSCVFARGIDIAGLQVISISVTDIERYVGEGSFSTTAYDLGRQLFFTGLPHEGEAAVTYSGRLELSGAMTYIYVYTPFATPVPEPGSFGTMLAGLGTLALLFRRSSLSATRE